MGMDIRSSTANLLLFVAIFSAYFLLSQGQRTYRRNCECDYTVDGRCAYTLVLPGPQSDQGSCPNPSTFPGSNNGTMSNENLNMLSTNLSNLSSQVAANRIFLDALKKQVDALQTSFQCASEKTGCSGLQNGTNNFPSLNNTTGSPVNNNSLPNPTPAPTGNTTVVDVRLTALESAMVQLKLDFDVVRTNLSKLAIDLSVLNMKMLDSTGIKSCSKPAMVITGKSPLTSLNITVSSIFGINDPSSSYSSSNFNISDNSSYWCPNDPNKPEEYIQFDLGSEIPIYGVATRGRFGMNQWVSSYKVKYGTLNESLTGLPNATIAWTSLMDPDQFWLSEMIFAGNVDNLSMKINYFFKPVISRFFRFIPLKPAMEGTNKCTRLDLIYCAS